MEKVLISVIGQDQPGILATVSECIYKNQGNIENVSQTLLQSIFGGLLIASIPSAISPERLEESLISSTDKLNLLIHVDTLPECPAPATSELTQPYIVTAAGADQKGLVYAVSNLLASHKINISNMQGFFKGGTRPLDNLMVFEVDVPKSTNMTEVRTALSSISSEQGLEINIQHRGIFDAVSHI